MMAKIDYWGEGVATFAPEKVLDKVAQWFPGVTVDPVDYSQEEVDKISKFVQETGSPAPLAEKRAFMIKQIQEKNRRNGPTFKFSFDSKNGKKINGHTRRYSVSFSSEGEIDDETQNKIIEFLKSLNLGEIILK